MKPLIIGSRGSQLALWQANYIAGSLNSLGAETQVQIIRTTGDHFEAASLAQPGGKGLFTKEIEEALLAGSIDLAVHSLKDLPTDLPLGLGIAAIPERESPFDAIMGSALRQLPKGARVGTSSGRRGAQLKHLRSDLEICPIRGNVDTRLKKLAAGEFQAILLAVAGLRRLGLESQIAEVFEPSEICPAPGQGALAIETRANDPAFDFCRRLNHTPSERAVRCERALLAGLGGGCQLPVGSYAYVEANEIHAMAVAVSQDGSRILRAEATGRADRPEEAGRTMAQTLLDSGAAELLSAAAVK